MFEQRTKLILDIRRKGQQPLTIDVVQAIDFGTDPRNDVILSAKLIQPKHLQICLVDGELVLKNFAKNNQTFLNSIALEANKSYLLDENDHILLADAEIIIKKVSVQFSSVIPHERAPLQEKRVEPNIEHLFQPESSLIPEEEKDKIKIQENPTGSMKLEKRMFPSFFEMMNRPSTLSLTVVKLYSLLLDLLVTYFVLGVVLPFYGFENEVNHLLSSFSAVLILTISEYLPLQLNFLFSLSGFSFFIAFYFIFIFQVLLFGSTLSQFLLGLNRKTLNNWNSLFFSRLKTFFLALIFVPGQNYISPHPLFSAFRKFGAFLLAIFIFISPVLWQNNLKLNMTIVPVKKLNIKKELKTQSLDFESSRAQISLQAELPYRFMFLPKPYLNKDQSFSIGFEFHDLIKKSVLTVTEIQVFSFEEFESLTSYSNPLQKIHFKTNLSQWSLKQKKAFLVESLKFSPLNIIELSRIYGPFFSSALQVRNKLLQPFNKNHTEFTVSTFSEDSPVVIINDKATTILYLIASEEIHLFELKSLPQDEMTLTYFNDYITNNFSLINSNENDYKKTNLDLFYALDKLMSGDEKTFLTYYVSLVNSDQTRLVSFNDLDLTFQVFKVIRENLKDLSKNLKSEDSQKTINQLIKQLTPMEIPGVRR